MEAADRMRLLYKYRWAMFAILATTYFFVYFHRMSVNALGTDMVADVGGGSKEYLSSVYFWTYAFMQIPSGILSDRLGPRKASSVFLAIAAVGSFITMFGESFLALAVGKVLIAAGMAVVYIPLMKIVSVWFEKRDFPQLNGIVIAVGNVGALAASAPLVYMAEAVGWRDVFLILGFITVVLSLLCFAFVRDHPRRIGMPGIEEIRAAETGVEDGDRSDGRVPVTAGLRTVFGSGRVFWTMGLAYFLIYGTIMVFQGTTSIMYFRSHVYGFALAAWFVTMIGVGKILSTVLIGRLVSRGVMLSKKKVMAFGTFAYMLVWLFIWSFAGGLDNQYVWFAVCALFGFFGGFMTLSFAQVKEWFPISIAGTAISSMNVLLFLGASIATTVAGLILHNVYSLENYSTLWAVMLLASAAAFVLVLLSKEKGEGDEMFVPAGKD